MANKPKPGLEEGNYIVYTNEPDTVVDAGSVGGGQSETYDLKIVFTAAERTAEIGAAESFNGVVKINDVVITGFDIEMSEGTKAAVKTVPIKALDFIYVDEGVLHTNGYVLNSKTFPEGYIPYHTSDGEISNFGAYAGTPYAFLESDAAYLVVFVTHGA